MKRIVTRIISSLLLIGILAMATGCADKTALPKLPKEEGIAPYELTKGESYVLQAFNLDTKAKIIAFNAPHEAFGVDVNVYRLDGDKWENIGGGAMSIGEDRKPVDKLSGTVAMRFMDDYSVGFSINTGGKGSYKTEPITTDSAALGQTWGFIQEFQTIEINKEIPVGIMVVDSGSTMQSYTLQDYFDASVFEGMDLVQVVTITFTDKIH